MSDTTFTLDVDGMHCGGCVRRVQGVLEKVPGVTLEGVAVGSATGTFDPDETSASALIDALQAAGYPSRVRASGAGS